MPTSSFETKFVIKNRQAVKNLELAIEAKQKLPNNNVAEKIKSGVQRFKESFPNSSKLN